MPLSPEKLSFEQIIEKYRENSTSERNKGDKFERLMQAYLLTKPTYKNLLSDVWLWADFQPFNYILRFCIKTVIGCINPDSKTESLFSIFRFKLKRRS